MNFKSFLYSVSPFWVYLPLAFYDCLLFGLHVLDKKSASGNQRTKVRFAHLFSPWHSTSKLASVHLAYRKRSLSRTFSRHGIAQASLTLLIWLNENVLLASADKVFGKRLKDKFMKKKKYECPSVVVTNVSFSIMSGSGGYDPYDPYYASTNFSEGEPVANTSLW